MSNSDMMADLASQLSSGLTLSEAFAAADSHAALTKAIKPSAGVDTEFRWRLDQPEIERVILAGEWSEPKINRQNMLMVYMANSLLESGQTDFSFGELDELAKPYLTKKGGGRAGLSIKDKNNLAYPELAPEVMTDKVWARKYANGDIKGYNQLPSVVAKTYIGWLTGQTYYVANSNGDHYKKTADKYKVFVPADTEEATEE